MSGKKSEAVGTTDDRRQTTDSSKEASALPHNRYHRAARSSAAMAIVYAAMAGRELIECSKGLRHGVWIKWVEKNCEFERTTAWRYMELAEKLKARLANVTHVLQTEDPNVARVQHLVSLLDRPPSELLPAEMETLLAELREATKGETLRQLYFDFGIASLPKPTGGANHLHSFLKETYPDHPEYPRMTLRELPKEMKKEWEQHLREEKPSEEFNQMVYRDTWRTLVKDLRENGLEKKTYAWLTREELEEVHGALIDVKKEIMEALKK